MSDINFLNLTATNLAWAEALLTVVLFTFIIPLSSKLLIYLIGKTLIRSHFRFDDRFANKTKKYIFIISSMFGIYFAVLIAPILNDKALLISKVAFASISFIIIMYMSLLAIFILNTTTQQNVKINSLTTNLIRLLIILIGIIVILSQLGVSILPMLTALGVGSLAIALALQDTLSNLFSGCYIIIGKQLKTGDFIKLDSGQEGIVHDISWRTTKIIENFTNNIHVIPNNKIAQTIVIKYPSMLIALLVFIDCSVSYDSDLEKVEKVAKDVTNNALIKLFSSNNEFEPIVRFSTFGDSAINFKIIAKSDDVTTRPVLIHTIIKDLHKKFKEEGIEIPFPQRVVHLVK
ncbi:MAG: mechanosensitive ion channel family protein [Endomicrobiaceae bacterium]|nr:mechanosensitive ion channel family protein [Endomicrobiaceae bacterium]